MKEVKPTGALLRFVVKIGVCVCSPPFPHKEAIMLSAKVAKKTAAKRGAAKPTLLAVLGA
jgi:hypothetical protein